MMTSDNTGFDLSLELSKDVLHSLLITVVVCLLLVLILPGQKKEQAAILPPAPQIQNTPPIIPPLDLEWLDPDFLLPPSPPPIPQKSA